MLTVLDESPISLGRRLAQLRWGDATFRANVTASVGFAIVGILLLLVPPNPTKSRPRGLVGLLLRDLAPGAQGPLSFLCGVASLGCATAIAVRVAQSNHRRGIRLIVYDHGFEYVTERVHGREVVAVPWSEVREVAAEGKSRAVILRDGPRLEFPVGFPELPSLQTAFEKSSPDGNGFRDIVRRLRRARAIALTLTAVQLPLFGVLVTRPEPEKMAVPWAAVATVAVLALFNRREHSPLMVIPLFLLLAATVAAMLRLR